MESERRRGGWRWREIDEAEEYGVLDRRLEMWIGERCDGGGLDMHDDALTIMELHSEVLYLDMRLCNSLT